MRPISSLIIFGSCVFLTATISFAGCSYELPHADPTLDASSSSGAAGFGGASSSSGAAGFGGASSSSSAESSSSAQSSSSSSGMPATCGNGIPEAGEQCDDGNSNPGDGCDASCIKEKHDGCDGTVLEMGQGTTLSFSDTTIGAVDDITRSATVQNCAAGDRFGPDMIYAIKPSFQGSLTATLEAKYNNHFLHIRNACPGQDMDEVACDYGMISSKVDVSKINVTAGNIVYVIVDGHLNDAGPFTLTVTLQ